MQDHIHSTGIGTAASVQAFAARNLQFLSTIENTLGRLEADMSLFRVMTVEFERNLVDLKSEPSKAALDPEGRVCDLLLKCADSVSRLFKHGTKAQKSAERDTRLTEEDGINAAYAEYVEALHHLHDGLEEFRDWIETHDALLEEAKPAVYHSADDLFKAIGI